MHLILQLINQLKSKNKSSHSKENTTLKHYWRLQMIRSGWTEPYRTVPTSKFQGKNKPDQTDVIFLNKRSQTKLPDFFNLQDNTRKLKFKFNSNIHFIWAFPTAAVNLILFVGS